MRVQSMLAKDSVSKRINSPNSLSFAEFAYQCLQANDFLHLHKQYGCVCQIGGSDQWGNITSGIDFVKRKTGDVSLFAFGESNAGGSRDYGSAADEQQRPKVWQVGGKRDLDQQIEDLKRTRNNNALLW